MDAPTDRNSSDDSASLSRPIDGITEDAVSNKAGRKPKKQLMQDSDKKFVCTFAGCDKKYGRAEHLYRHELNHAPKDVYSCDRPNCKRRFVRKDLLHRHRKRHIEREAGNVISTSERYDPPGTIDHPSLGEERRDSTLDADSWVLHDTIDSPVDSSYEHASVQSPNSSRVMLPSSPNTYLAPSWQEFHYDMRGPNNGHANLISSEPNMFSVPRPPTFYQSFPHLTINEAAESYRASCLIDSNQVSQPLALTPSQHGTAQTNFPPAPNNLYVPVSRNQYDRGIPHQIRQSAMSLAWSEPLTNASTYEDLAMSYNGFGLSHQSHIGDNSATRVASTGEARGYPAHQNTLISLVTPATSYSPSCQFYPWLFEGSLDQSAQSLALLHGMSILDNDSTGDEVVEGLAAANGATRSPSEHEPGEVVFHNERPRAFESTFDSERRVNFTRLILETFKDDRNPKVKACRERLLAGNCEDFPHVLSLPVLQIYLSSFWQSIHPQFPILHRPTFSSDGCPDALLIVVIALGAEALDSQWGQDFRQRSSEFASFLIWHVRLTLYADLDFGPPARLWVLQALALIELYEKSFGWRDLHDRAYTHHSTLITLTRLGVSTLGRHAQTHVTDNEDGTRTPPGPGGSINTGGFNTATPEWNKWISLEATRRTAFAVFILDSTHAQMFSHHAIMTAQEIAWTLPCDDRLWEARSWPAAQHARLEVEAAGEAPINFLDALKRSIHGKPVHSTPFGYAAIMAGLLSLSGQLKAQNQNSQVRHLERKSDWPQQLMRAFDSWKRDYYALTVVPLSLVQRRNASLANNPGVLPDAAGLHSHVFEARGVLYSLAYLSMQCDPKDCALVAGPRIIGQAATVPERDAALLRIQTWARSPRGRDAAFHALTFLADTLGPGYSIIDDVLLNRPWVLYLSGLVLWAYGYALDGPLAGDRSLSVQRLRQSPALRAKEANDYLCGMGGVVRSPQGWASVSGGRNEMLGLLLTLEGEFRVGRWGLFREAADMMDKCVKKLLGAPE